MKKIIIKIPKIKQRVMWDFKPISRIKESKKIYSRKNLKRVLNDN